MNSYMDKKLEQQAINAWYDVTAEILTPEELCLVKIKLIEGKIKRICPNHIEEKITKFFSVNQQ